MATKENPAVFDSYQDYFQKTGPARGIPFAGKDFALAMAGRATPNTMMTVHLYPGQQCYTELGMMRSKDGEVELRKHWGDASGGLINWAKRKIAGEDIRVAQFVNPTSDRVLTVEVTPESYSGLYAFELDKEKNGTVYCRPGALVLSSTRNHVDFSFFENLLKPVSWFHKKPYLMEKLQGDDLLVIACPHAPMREVLLAKDQTHIFQSQFLHAHTEMKTSLVMTAGLGATIGNLLARIPGLKFLGNNEDILNLEFTGPGKVILTNAPAPK